MIFDMNMCDGLGDGSMTAEYLKTKCLFDAFIHANKFPDENLYLCGIFIAIPFGSLTSNDVKSYCALLHLFFFIKTPI